MIRPGRFFVDQMVREIARHQPCALQVGVDDVVPIFFGVLEERFRDHDPGVVDQDRSGPSCSSALASRRRCCARSVTSQATGRQCAAAPFDASAIPPILRCGAPRAATLAPACANISAKRRPMPLDAPVTNATSPATSKIGNATTGFSLAKRVHSHPDPPPLAGEGGIDGDLGAVRGPRPAINSNPWRGRAARISGFCRSRSSAAARIRSSSAP